MSNYWFNRQEIFQKEKKKNLLKRKLQSIMRKTKKLQKISQKNVIKTCHKKKITRLRSNKKKHQELVQPKKEALKIFLLFLFLFFA